MSAERVIRTREVSGEGWGEGKGGGVVSCVAACGLPFPTRELHKKKEGGYGGREEKVQEKGTRQGHEEVPVNASLK